MASLGCSIPGMSLSSTRILYGPRYPTPRTSCSSDLCRSQQGGSLPTHRHSTESRPVPAHRFGCDASGRNDDDLAEGASGTDASQSSRDLFQGEDAVDVHPYLPGGTQVSNRLERGGPPLARHHPARPLSSA